MYHCDKHVVKMVTETAQLLCSAYYYTDWKGDVPYGLTHYNHPCAIWVRESRDNWIWTLTLGLSLYGEYMFRYGEKSHAGGRVIVWCSDNIPNLVSKGITPQPLCMPNEYKSASSVDSYRAYYIGEKSKMFKWTNREVPEWIPKGLLQ